MLENNATSTNESSGTCAPERVSPEFGTGIPDQFNFMRQEPYTLPESKNFTDRANDDMKRYSEQIGDNASYLNWSIAWRAFKEDYPQGTFRYMTDSAGNPYIHDQNLGYRVGIHLSLDGKTYMPVVQRGVYYGTATDANEVRVMRNKAYTYKDAFGNDLECPAATYADIEKALMRCLVKAIAIHTGIGLIFYTKNQQAKFLSQKDLELASKEDVDELRKQIKDLGFNVMTMVANLPEEFGKRPAGLDGINVRQYEWIATRCLKRMQVNNFLAGIEERLKKIKADIPALLNSIPAEKGGPVKNIYDAETKAQFTFLAERCAQLEKEFTATNEPPKPAPRPRGRSAKATAPA